MINIITIYSLIALIILLVCAKISYKFNLLDSTNKRKIHTTATAFTGGIGISIILVFSNLLFDYANLNLEIILSVAFLMSTIGFIDDKLNLNASGKLSLQIIPIFYLIIFKNFTIINLGNYDYFTLNLGTFQMPFTLICVLFLINSFNYFDGMDGTLSFASISVLAILYFLITDNNFRLFLIIILIPIGIFLCFNFSLFKLPKMFLGDSGSLLIGFIISFLLIYLAQQNLIHPILIAWSVTIFVFEFISLNIIRVLNKKGMFEPNQDHLHHIIFIRTKSIFLTNFFIFSINIILFVLGYNIFLLISPLFSLILFIFFFLIFFILRIKFSVKNINIKIK